MSALSALLAVCILLTASTTWAQPAEGVIVSGAVGATVLDESSNLSFVAAAGYRFNSAFGLGIELTSVPMLESEQPFGRIPLPVSGAISFGEPEGQVTVFTTNMRLEVATTSRRVVPYAVAGGGVANIKESFLVTYSLVRPLIGYSELSFLQTSPELVLPFPIPLPRPQPVSYSSVAMALTLGGGVSVLAGDHLSIDVDLRYLRLLGETDRNIGRFGAGASYRF